MKKINIQQTVDNISLFLYAKCEIVLEYARDNFKWLYPLSTIIAAIFFSHSMHFDNDFQMVVFSYILGILWPVITAYWLLMNIILLTH